MALSPGHVIAGVPPHRCALRGLRIHRFRTVTDTLQGNIGSKTSGMFGDATLVNQGLISSDGGGTLTINPTLLVNSGKIDSKVGSTVHITSPLQWTGGSMGGAGPVRLSAALNVTGDVVKHGRGAMRVAGAFTLAAGKKFDLTEGKLILQQAAAGAADNNGVYNGVQGLVQSASNYSAWDGAGITTSMTDAREGPTTIGVATGAQARGLGQTHVCGDANLDGQVDASDFGVLDFFVGDAGVDGFSNGDFNYDGIIDASPAIIRRSVLGSVGHACALEARWPSRFDETGRRINGRSCVGSSRERHVRHPRV